MAMTANGMGDAILAALNAVPPIQTSNPADITAYQQAIWRAIGNAITTYIQDNAKATGTDSRLDTHDLTIT